MRVLNTPNVELRNCVMDGLALLVYQLSTEYTIFIPIVNKALVKNKIHHETYELLVSKLLKNEPFPLDLFSEVEEK